MHCKQHPEYNRVCAACLQALIEDQGKINLILWDRWVTLYEENPLIREKMKSIEDRLYAKRG